MKRRSERPYLRIITLRSAEGKQNSFKQPRESRIIGA